MKLSYKAIGKDGKKIQGIIEAKDVKEASIFLRKKELVPISVRPKGKTMGGAFSFFQKINPSDVVFFTRQLSLMISSGLTLMQALQILKDQVQNPAMVEATEGMITDIQGGTAFSTALGKYPDVFSPIYISLVKSAESSGLFDKVLLKLADNLEKHEKLVKTIKGALIYPAIVLVMMLGVLIIMLVFVIPPLARLYSDLNIKMPLPTRIILGMSTLVTHYGIVLALVGVGLAYGFRRWQQTTRGQETIDKLSLKMPVFGKLFQEQILAEFSRTSGLLIGTGVLVVDSLLQSSETTNNSIYKGGIVEVSRMVEKGVSVGDALSTNEIFSPILVQMAKIGEQTGKLDESFMRVAEYYEEEVDALVKNLTTLMEPFIIVFLGVGVGFLIISIITPIYGLISSIH